MNHRLNLLLLLTLGICQLGLQSACADEGDWITLFNGENLDGWTSVGGTGEYRVEEDCIVGKTVSGSPNTFLCTDNLYGDFELEIDFKADPLINSGIQIRSHVHEKRRRNSVAGYQVEIVSDGEAGFIYNEGYGGWLSQDREDPVKNNAINVDDWNHFRIRCVGDHLQTWLNDIPIADEHHGRDAEGFIGLQIHGYRGPEPVEIRWRNIRIREISE